MCNINENLRVLNHCEIIQIIENFILKNVNIFGKTLYSSNFAEEPKLIHSHSVVIPLSLFFINNHNKNSLNGYLNGFIELYFFLSAQLFQKINDPNYINYSKDKNIKDLEKLFTKIVNEAFELINDISIHKDITYLMLETRMRFKFISYFNANGIKRKIYKTFEIDS